MGIKRVWSKRHEKHVWAYDIRLSGRRIRDSGFATKTEVEEAVAALRLAARADKYGLSRPRTKITVQDLVAALKRDLPPRNYYRRAVLRNLQRFAAGYKKLLIELKTADFRSYVTVRQKAGIAAVSINTELLALSSALRSAEQYFADHEGYKPPRIPLLPRAKGRRERVWGREEATNIIQLLRQPCVARQRDGSPSPACRLFAADVLEVELLTSLRMSDVLVLHKSDCNFHWKTLRVESVKTKTTRTIPMGDRVRKILQRRCEKAPVSGFLFAGLTGKSKPENERRWMGVEVRKALKWACELLKIPYGRGVAGGLLSHDARHTATSIMLQGGTDLATVMSVTGHSGRTMALHYGHASHASKQRAIATLEEFGVVTSGEVEWSLKK